MRGHEWCLGQKGHGVQQGRFEASLGFCRCQSLSFDWLVLKNVLHYCEMLVGKRGPWVSQMETPVLSSLCFHKQECSANQPRMSLVLPLVLSICHLQGSDAPTEGATGDPWLRRATGLVSAEAGRDGAPLVGLDTAQLPECTTSSRQFTLQGQPGPCSSGVAELSERETSYSPGFEDGGS